MTEGIPTNSLSQLVLHPPLVLLPDGPSIYSILTIHIWFPSTNQGLTESKYLNLQQSIYLYSGQSAC